MTKPRTPKDYLPPIAHRQAQEIYKMVQALQKEIISDYTHFKATAFGLTPPYNENPSEVWETLNKDLAVSQDDLIHKTEVIKEWLQLFFDDDKAVLWS